MRKEITEYTKTVTKDTPLTEVVEVVQSEEELEYLLKALERQSE